jgi:glycosyltransferase involved in cell wall biosynthesis
MLTPRTIALKLEYHLFKKDRALLRGLVPAGVQARLRRRARAKYLLWDARKYNEWLQGHLRERRLKYQHAIEPGLLSVVTPVWDGTPLHYLRALAESIIAQNQNGAAEWVVVSNGVQKKELLAYFETLQQHSWVKVHASRENTGIIGGMRLCLERATGRYILPVDSDDWLYPDCLQVVAWWIHEANFPPLLYTDEDKLIGDRAVQPYLKPSFDPVLLLNSAYIAHLGVIDRKLALELGAYSDKRTEGSPDWDLFLRFLASGHSAVHIPEVVYSWRMHPESTADDALSKPYIHDSQRAVLQRYLDSTGAAQDCTVEYSPVLNRTADWWLQPRANQPQPWPVVTLPISKQTSVTSLVESMEGSLGSQGLNHQEGLVCLVADDMQIDHPDYLQDAIALMKRHPDTVMIGGPIRDSSGVIQSAGCVLGFEGDCGCPDRGRPVVDPGFFTQLKKQRSVSAVSSQFAVMRASFLRDLYRSGAAAQASVAFLGAWAGAYALRTQKRVVYSPFLSAVSSVDWDALATAEERARFRKIHSDILPDQRFYSRYFGLNKESVYQPGRQSASQYGAK